MYKAFKDIIEGRTYLERDRSGLPVNRKLRLAVATLVWAVMNSDHERTAEEFAAALRAINHEFHILDSESADLLRSAASLLKEHHRELDIALGEINRAYDTEQRKQLAEVLLMVAKADKRIAVNENEFLDVIFQKLNLAV